MDFNKPSDLKGKEQNPGCLQGYMNLKSILRSQTDLDLPTLRQVNYLT